MGPGPARTQETQTLPPDPGAVPPVDEPAPAGHASEAGQPLLARVFINRNFAIYTAGSFVSATGGWFQVVALGWLAVTIGGRQAGFLLGLVGFASLIPILLLGLVGGLLADRLDRRLLLLATILFNAVTLVILAMLTGAGRASAAVILIFALVTGVSNALTWPTWQAMINTMVGTEDLARAIALNSARFNLTRVVGPALGGLLLTVIGPAWCFAANALTSLVVMAALLALHLPPRTRRPREPLRQALFGGLLYAREAPRARTILLATAALGVLGLPYNSFLPAFAKDVLHTGPDGLGLLLAAVGVGALAGALASGMSVLFAHRRSVLCAALVLFGIGDTAFTFSHWLPLSLVALALLGFAMLLYLATANTLLQSEVPSAVLGRLMGIWVIVTSGTTPVGSLAIGALSAAIGVQWAVGLGGLGCVLCGALLARARHIG